jgi:hypothetical protein
MLPRFRRAVTTGTPWFYNGNYGCFPASFGDGGRRIDLPKGDHY